MPKIDEITISKSCRLNLGNYEGTEHFISVKGSMGQKEDRDLALMELDKKASAVMVETLFRSYGARGKKLSREQIAQHHGLYYEKDEAF